MCEIASLFTFKVLLKIDTFVLKCTLNLVLLLKLLFYLNFHLSKKLVTAPKILD